MFVFLDFEASSLSKQSHPVEVGWVGEDGAGESHLIRLRDTEVAFAAAAAARATVAATPAGHRALGDARREWAVWRAILEAA